VELSPVKMPVDGVCPECDAHELRQYPVLAADGWFEVVKCAARDYGVAIVGDLDHPEQLEIDVAATAGLRDGVR
jgi:hypothetical protein